MEKAAIAESVSMLQESDSPFCTHDGNDPVLEQAAIAESIALSSFTNVDRNEQVAIIESIELSSIMNAVVNEEAVITEQINLLLLQMWIDLKGT